MSKAIITERIFKGVFNSAVLCGATAAGLATTVALVPAFGLGAIVTGTLATGAYVGVIGAKQSWK